MGDEDSAYKVEYLDLAEDAPAEERELTWIAKAGRAKVTYDSGATYEGEFNDEKQKHGKGTFTWMTTAEGDEEPKVHATYSGEYKDGKREGEGKMTYPSGDAYTGQWKAGKMHGAF